MLQKNDFLLIISGIPIAICIGLIDDYRFSNLINHQTHLLLIFSYGGIVSIDRFDLFLVLLFSIPFIFNVLFFCNDLHRDFSIALVYIFTRKDTRNKWLTKKCFFLELKSGFFYIVQFLFVIVISIVKGFEISLIDTINVIFLLAITLIFINNLLLLIGCIVSIKKSSPLFFLGVIGVYMGWIFLLPLIKESKILLEIIPITRTILLAHNIANYNVRLGMPFTLNIFSTFIWGLLTRIVLYILSIKWIENTDLI
jgi:hypothetical protein